jgi:NADH/NAD ratio-sensing transcriptional regulator Rex
MIEEERNLCEEVTEIKQIVDRIEDELISINTILRFLDVNRFNELIDKIRENQENLEIIKEKEEKLQNVYNALRIMINECKGIVAMTRPNLKTDKE